VVECPDELCEEGCIETLWRRRRVTIDHEARSATGFMYILRCRDGSYYVGSTRNIDVRLRQHQEGDGAEYSKRRRPVELVYCLPCESIVQAFWFEKKVQK
jgi:predicted GIY-YIG superfamily endonuclease